jgi:hypothetical protein
MKLHKLSPKLHDAFLTVTKKAASYSPGLHSPIAGRFAYETSPNYDCCKTGTIYTTEDPSVFEDSPGSCKKKPSNLTLVTKFNKDNTTVTKTAPTPNIRRSPTSPTSAKSLFAFGDTYEYKYDGWKDNLQHWRNSDVEREPSAPTSLSETIKPKKTGLGGRFKTVFFQQQLNHATLPPQHLGMHEQHL